MCSFLLNTACKLRLSSKISVKNKSYQNRLNLNHKNQYFQAFLLTYFCSFFLKLGNSLILLAFYSLLTNLLINILNGSHFFS